MDLVHMDFAGPFCGKMFMLLVDTHSKWPEILEMTSTTTDNTIATLRCMFSAFGLPEQLVTPVCVMRICGFNAGQWRVQCMLLTIMTYIIIVFARRVLPSLHVYGFTATCFSCMAYLRMLSVVVGPHACCSSNVSCAIVICVIVTATSCCSQCSRAW